MAQKQEEGSQFTPQSSEGTGIAHYKLGNNIVVLGPYMCVLLILAPGFHALMSSPPTLNEVV